MLSWILTHLYKILDICKTIRFIVWNNQKILINQSAELAEIRATQAEQSKLLEQILAHFVLPEAVSVVFQTEIDGELQEITKMIIDPRQTFPLPVEFLDKNKKPAPVDGIPEWSVDNESLLTMVVAADGMSAVISSNDTTGSATISVVADADMGEGVREITGILPVTVKPLEAVVVELTPGPVTDLP